MNYLELAQTLRVKCRAPGTGPSAVTGQNAEYTRLLMYTNEAWLEIQGERPDWKFLRASCSCETIEGVSSYYAEAHFNLTDFGSWALDYHQGDTFRCYTTEVGLPDEQLLGILQYDDWRNLYLLGSSRTQYQRPSAVADAPDHALIVGPVPAEGYTILGDYYREPTEMEAADDTPSLPRKYHWAIIYRAMMAYGVGEAAPEIYDEGLAGYRRLIRRIEATELPQIMLPPPLC